MVTSAQEILEVVDAAAAVARPEKIVVFGSYAYGEPNADSDVDLLVVSNRRESRHAQAVRICRKVPAPFALDMIVRSEAEIQRRIIGNDFFLKEIMDKGIVVYAANDPRVGAEGRKRLRRRLDTVAVA